MRCVAILLGVLVVVCAYGYALNPGLGGGREQGAESSFRDLQNVDAQGGHAQWSDLRFAHLTTSDGLSGSAVTTILQDHRGFMWFGTGDGLNRYDGNAFIGYKNKADDPASLSSNQIKDLMEDDRGHLWIATYTGGVNKFDPVTERFTRYRHDPGNPNTLIADSVNSIARDRRGFLWCGTEASGLDKFDPSSGTSTHYLNDNDGQFVGRITKVIEGRQGDIWFVGRRGLFHLHPQTGEIARAPGIGSDLGADYVYEDEVGNLWMLAYSPIVGLIKYDPTAQRLMKYPVGSRAVGLVSSKLLADGQNGFWVPSSLGLYYFDRRTEQLTRLFQHLESNPDSLNDDAVVSIYQDRGGVLWVGTQNGGLNVLNFQQQQFGRYMHRLGDANSLSPGKVTSLYQDSTGILWVGLFPRALDRLDRKTGKVTHYVRGLEDRKNATSKGTDVNSIYKDARGYVWLGGWGSGLDRLDRRTGQFKHYRHNPDDPNSLTSDHVLRIYGDRGGQLWVGHIDGITRLDPATEQFTYFRPDPSNPSSYGNAAVAFYQDRSGTMWISRGEGVLSRYDDKTKTFVNYTPDPRDPHRLKGGDISAILEDRTGTLWLGAGDGLYRFNRQDETFTRYTESEGLPSSTIQGILEDKNGRLWLSTKNGISRFDSSTKKFRNYDVSDGLQANEFSQGCFTQGPNREMFFGGSHGFNAFFPENIRDNPYVPPVVITSFKIFNKPISTGPKSVLKKAISYVNSLTLSYHDIVFSLEFAALSYANSQKNRYRYKLEGFDPGWNEVDSKHRVAIYTNLDPGTYVFRVKASNSDGVWNEAGVSLPILITPPWWKTNWFRAVCAMIFLALLWAAYQFRVRQLQWKFNLASEARLNERMRIAHELHDNLLQTVQGLMLSLQAVSEMMPAEAAKNKLEKTLEIGDRAIREGRYAVQDLRSASITSNLTQALRELGDELARPDGTTFRLLVEGPMRELNPIVRDEIFSIAREALRNAFTHACATRIEAEIGFKDRLLQLRIRDDGKGIPPEIAEQGRAGHYGLPGMRERARQMDSKLVILSGSETGTEIELIVPGCIAYAKQQGRSRFMLFRWNGGVRT